MQVRLARADGDAAACCDFVVLPAFDIVQYEYRAGAAREPMLQQHQRHQADRDVEQRDQPKRDPDRHGCGPGKPERGEDQHLPALLDAERRRDGEEHETDEGAEGFDADGGHGESYWTQDGNRWIIKATGVTPEGSVGSATYVMALENPNKLSLKIYDRIVGDKVEPNVEVTLVRKAPTPK